MAGPGETFMLKISELEQDDRTTTGEEKSGCAAGSMVLVGMTLLAFLLW